MCKRMKRSVAYAALAAVVVMTTWSGSAAAQDSARASQAASAGVALSTAGAVSAAGAVSVMPAAMLKDSARAADASLQRGFGSGPLPVADEAVTAGPPPNEAIRR